MVPETRAELPQAQSPGPAAQQDTSRAPHSHPWGRDCSSHRPPSPTASSRCCGSRAQPLPSLLHGSIREELGIVMLTQELGSLMPPPAG